MQTKAHNANDKRFNFQQRIKTVCIRLLLYLTVPIKSRHVNHKSLQQTVNFKLTRRLHIHQLIGVCPHGVDLLTDAPALRPRIVNTLIVFIAT